jgi:hypothetical protein
MLEVPNEFLDSSWYIDSWIALVAPYLKARRFFLEFSSPKMTLGFMLSNCYCLNDSIAFTTLSCCGYLSMIAVRTFHLLFPGGLLFLFPTSAMNVLSMLSKYS